MTRARRPGGVRAGTPGTAYTNRSDLNSERSLPVRTVPGQTYGAAAAQAEAQKIVPMRPAQTPGAPPAGAAPAATMPPAPGMGAPGTPPMQPIAPGAFGDLHRPTERPNEPVTAGAAQGPGPGPEVLPTQQGLTGGAMSALLQQAAQRTGNSSLAGLAQRAASTGQ